MARKEGQGRFGVVQNLKIKSALEGVRRLGFPKNIDGEPVVYAGQAGYDGGSAFKSLWKMGQLFLTQDKLLFYQGRDNVIRQIDVSLIQQIEVLERDWVPGRKTTQLCVIEQRGDMRRKTFFGFTTGTTGTEEWRDRIQKLLNGRR